MKPKPDDRRDNVDRIQNNIDNTLKNIDKAEEMRALSDNPQQKKALKAKNIRREEALEGFRNEIKDEARDKKRSH